VKSFARMFQRKDRGWYGDFRNYAAQGGGREALIPEGGKRATHDEDVARSLYLARLAYLQGRREGRIAPPSAALAPVPTMTAYLDRHEELKGLDGRARPETIARERAKLDQIATWWNDPRLDAISPKHFNDLQVKLKGLAPQTRAHYVNAVSTLLKSAVSDGHVAVNAAQSVKRPRVARGEAAWLESHEGHALLVAAAELDQDDEYHGFRPLEAVIGAALLTGFRRSELFALLVEDVDFNAGVVHARPNPYYPVRKSRHAIRRVPLWPQLRSLLVPYVGQRETGPLFVHGNGKRVTGWLDLDPVFAKAKLERPKDKAWHLFRHTYTAMRLQTTDNGAPVSPWTVKTELGHGSLSLIESTYGHLLEVRHRLDRVEYRPKLTVEKAEASA
jgi:integrase